MKKFLATIADGGELDPAYFIADAPAEKKSFFQRALEFLAGIFR